LSIERNGETVLKAYGSLFRHYKEQPANSIFAHFYPVKQGAAAPDYDEPWKAIARDSLDGYESWTFQQPRFRAKHANSPVPKLKNYLNYTFIRLVTLEQENKSPQIPIFSLLPIKSGHASIPVCRILLALIFWQLFNATNQGAILPPFTKHVQIGFIKGVIHPITGNIVIYSELGFLKLRGTQKIVEITFLIPHTGSTRKHSTISLSALNREPVCQMRRMRLLGITCGELSKIWFRRLRGTIKLPSLYIMSKKSACSFCFRFFLQAAIQATFHPFWWSGRMKTTVTD